MIIAALFVVPWLATLGGSLLGLRLKLRSARSQAAFLGFAAGVMVASSFWSLLIPAFDHSGGGLSGAGIVTAGFALGCLGMLLLDHLTPHQHFELDKPEGLPSHLSRPMLLVMAVALHNIPEGMALGVVMSAMSSGEMLGPSAAMAFGMGLALQNFPEGMAVVVPMRGAGLAIKKCAFWGVLASFAEPLSALIGFAAASALSSLGGVVMPILLGTAAGAMIYIVVEELIPGSQSFGPGHAATFGFLTGFWIMATMGFLGA